MKKGLAVGLALLVCFLIQTGVLPALGESSIAPDLILVVLIPAAVLWKAVPVAFMGAAVGVVIDVLFGRGIGLYAIPYLVFPWVIGVYGRQFFHENALIPAILAGVCHLLSQVFTALAIYLGRMELAITGELLLRTLASVLFTAGLTVPSYLLMFGFINRREKRRPGVIMIGR